MRLSCPSWVIPGTWVENLKHMEGDTRVQAVELLFFEADNETRTLFEGERETVLALAGRFGYSVHLPGRINREHAWIIEATQAFAENYIVHPSGNEVDISHFVSTMDEWRTRYGDRFLLENTDYSDFERCMLALPEIGICFDSGHVLLESAVPAERLESLLASGRRIGEIHVHGVSQGMDHQAFSLDDQWLLDLSPFISTFDGTVEIEVFSWTELSRCIDAVRSIACNPG